MTEQAPQTDAVSIIEQQTPAGTLGLIALNNPQALNAVTLEMFQALEQQLLEWRQRADIVCVVLHAVVEDKDVRFLHLMKVTPPRDIARLQNDDFHGGEVDSNSRRRMLIRIAFTRSPRSRKSSRKMPSR